MSWGVWANPVRQWLWRLEADVPPGGIALEFALQEDERIRFILFNLPYPIARSLLRATMASSLTRYCDAMLDFSGELAVFLRCLLEVTIGSTLQSGGLASFKLATRKKIRDAFEGKGSFKGKPFDFDLYPNEGSTNFLSERLLNSLRKRFPLSLQRHQVRGILENLPELKNIRNKIAHPVHELSYDEAQDVKPGLESHLIKVLNSLEFLSSLRCLAVIEAADPKKNGKYSLNCQFLSGPKISNVYVKCRSKLRLLSGTVLLANQKLTRAVNLLPYYRAEISNGSVDRVLAWDKIRVKDNTVNYRDVVRRTRQAEYPLIPGGMDAAGLNTMADFLKAGLRGTSAQKFLKLEPIAGLNDLYYESLKLKKVKKFISSHVPLTDINFMTAGGMAYIFSARDKQTGERRVVKFSKNLGVPELYQKIEDEGSTLATLESEKLVKVHHIEPRDGEKELGPFMVEDFILGSTAEDLLEELKVKSGGKPIGMKPTMAAPIIFGVLDALKVLHDNNIVHRDLKPGNIMCRFVGVEKPEGKTAEGQGDDAQRWIVKLIDLGIAKELGGKSHNTTQISFGTENYAAPEQLSSSEGPSRVDTRTDIFALGIVMYEFFTGHVPEKDEGKRVFHWSEVPGYLQPIIKKCCQTEKENRYSDVSALLAALKRALRVTGQLGEEIRQERITEALRLLNGVYKSRNNFDYGFKKIKKRTMEQLEAASAKFERRLTKEKKEIGMLRSSRILNERFQKGWESYIRKCNKVGDSLREDTRSLITDYAKSVESAVEKVDSFVTEHQVETQPAGADSADMGVLAATAATVAGGATTALVSSSPGWLASLLGASSLAGPVGWTVAGGGLILGGVVALYRRKRAHEELFRKHLEELEKVRTKREKELVKWTGHVVAKVHEKVQVEVNSRLRELLRDITLELRLEKHKSMWLVELDGLDWPTSLVKKPGKSFTAGKESVQPASLVEVLVREKQVRFKLV